MQGTGERPCPSILPIPGPGLEPADEAKCELREGHDGRHRDSRFETARGTLEWNDGELPWRVDWKRIGVAVLLLIALALLASSPEQETRPEAMANEGGVPNHELGTRQRPAQERDTPSVAPAGTNAMTTNTPARTPADAVRDSIADIRRITSEYNTDGLSNDELLDACIQLVQGRRRRARGHRQPEAERQRRLPRHARRRPPPRGQLRRQRTGNHHPGHHPREPLAGQPLTPLLHPARAGAVGPQHEDRALPFSSTALPAGRKSP